MGVFPLCIPILNPLCSAVDYSDFEINLGLSNTPELGCLLIVFKTNPLSANA